MEGLREPVDEIAEQVRGKKLLMEQKFENGTIRKAIRTAHEEQMQERKADLEIRRVADMKEIEELEKKLNY